MAGLRSPSSRAIRCSASDGIFDPSACGSNVRVEMGANAASRFVPAGESHLDGLPVPVLHAVHVLCCVYTGTCVCVPGVCSLYDLNLGTGVARLHWARADDAFAPSGSSLGSSLGSWRVRSSDGRGRAAGERVGG